ncbi:MAG: hypothetical protein JST00_11285 [Deltaproteobacteria bacterium]|nr:hypothetical protein [Deltaproteobacteria bacterium]
MHSARADEPARVGRTSSLAWVRLPGAESCIAAPALAMAVEKKLGRRVFVPPSDAEITVEGTIEWRAEPKRARATFRVSDRAGKVLGSRSVDEPAASCEKLDDRLAFVVALLIDPEAAMGGDAEPAAPAPDPSLTTPLPPPPTPAPPPVDARVAALPSEEAPPPWRWMLGAEFGGAAGLVPDVGWVVSGSLLVTPPRWPGIRAKGSSFLPTSRRVEGVALAEIGLVSGELGICPLEWRPAPFGITLCASGLLGQLDARGQGFPESRGYSTTLGGLAIDAVLELHFTKAVGLTLSPALVVPLSRARLAYEDSAGVRRTIFDMSAVGGSLAIGLSVGSR